MLNWGIWWLLCYLTCYLSFVYIDALFLVVCFYLLVIVVVVVVVVGDLVGLEHLGEILGETVMGN